MENDHELFIDSVACRFGKRMVLSSVFVNCKVGEVVGLLGRNGAGKSTLMKVIFGALNGYYKYCKLNGRLFMKGYRTRHIAYLSQQPMIPSYVKVGFAAKLYAGKYKEQLMANTFIQHHHNQLISSLSVGVRRMIEALIILYSDAQFVLLDEPFSNIAPLYIDEINRHINLLKSEKGFIITDHYYERILEISDRIVLIHNGCNYQINTREDLLTHGYIPASALD